MLPLSRFRPTAAAACRWAEDERDTREVDDLLNQLEACISGLYAARAEPRS